MLECYGEYYFTLLPSCCEHTTKNLEKNLLLIHAGSKRSVGPADDHHFRSWWRLGQVIVAFFLDRFTMCCCQRCIIYSSYFNLRHVPHRVRVCPGVSYARSSPWTLPLTTQIGGRTRLADHDLAQCIWKFGVLTSAHFLGTVQAGHSHCSTFGFTRHGDSNWLWQPQVLHWLSNWFYMILYDFGFSLFVVHDIVTKV